MILYGSIWENLVNVLNETEVGDTVTRKQLCSTCDRSMVYQGTNGYAANGVPSSLDTYRRILEVLGYLSKQKRKGHYTKLADIPDDLTMTEARNQYDQFMKDHISRYDPITNEHIYIKKTDT